MSESFPDRSHESPELLIQRCVDGELTPAEQVELIRRLEHSRDLAAWRELAIGFLEYRILCQQFQLHSNRENLNSLAQAPTPVDPTVSPSRGVVPLHRNAARGASAETDRSGDDTTLNSVSRSTGSASASSASSPLGMVTILAAAVVLGTFIGRGLSPHLDSATKPASFASNPLVESPFPAIDTHEPLPALSAGKSPLTPVMQVQVLGHPDKPTENFVIPIYASQEIPNSQMFVRGDALPQEVKQHLEEMGYVFEKCTKCYRVPLQNGQQLIIPTETVQIRHASR